MSENIIPNFGNSRTPSAKIINSLSKEKFFCNSFIYSTQSATFVTASKSPYLIVQIFFYLKNFSMRLTKVN